jgi:hypothetical protein
MQTDILGARPRRAVNHNYFVSDSKFHVERQFTPV